MLPALALAAALLACAPSDDVRVAALPRPGSEGTTLLVEGLLNGSFELLADDSTTPPKYGAYWLGAFSPREGDAADLVQHGDNAAEGQAWLTLPADGPVVLQKIVADPRWTAELVLHLTFRGPPGATLQVRLEDGPGRTTTRQLAPEAFPAEANGWRRCRLTLGADFLSQHGHAPVPRLNLLLSALGGPVDVDAVSAEVTLPLVRPEQASAVIHELVQTTLATWFLPPEGGGLGLVDPDSGYVLAESFHVDTGADVKLAQVRGLHSLHALLMSWLAHCEATGREDELQRWRPWLATMTRTILDKHFLPSTQLPHIAHPERGPLLNSPVTVGAYVEFLTAAAELVHDEELAQRCRQQVRATGDALLALQAEHDRDPVIHPNSVKLDRSTGRFEGEHDNWFGHIPNRLTPLGKIDGPRQYNTAWAIVTGRSFWYHLLKSPAAVMAAHEVEPRPGDLAGIERAISRYQRDWDAARYDLENDTDDHYGYLAEDLHTLLRHGGAVHLPQAIALLQQATDHRLARDVGGLDHTVWIQAVRLGTSCAGDSPRAFKGVLDLYELPPEVNPVSSGLPLYRDAILELAANDWKGRQLTNSQFTESFFANWEMVCICFKGTYQGDCRERPLDSWDGDVGDIFGGPPLQGINAQVWAYQVAAPEQRHEILARLGTLHFVTESGLRREHGWLHGLDPQVARAYGLPEKYSTGLDPSTAAGVGYVNAWMAMLPLLQSQ